MEWLIKATPEAVYSATQLATEEGRLSLAEAHGKRQLVLDLKTRLDKQEKERLAKQEKP